MKTPRKRTTSTGTTADTPTARKRSTRTNADNGEMGDVGADGRSAQPERSAPRTDDMPRNDDEIRERAYHIYLARGGAPGGELEDWLQAEREQQQEDESGTTRSGQRPQSPPPGP